MLATQCLAAQLQMLANQTSDVGNSIFGSSVQLKMLTTQCRQLIFGSSTSNVGKQSFRCWQLNVWQLNFKCWQLKTQMLATQCLAAQLQMLATQNSDVGNSMLATHCLANHLQMLTMLATHLWQLNFKCWQLKTSDVGNSMCNFAVSVKQDLENKGFLSRLGTSNSCYQLNHATCCSASCGWCSYTLRGFALAARIYNVD